MILYINCCVRKNSRTDVIARHLLSKLGQYTEVNPEKENLLPLNEERLEDRNNLIASGRLDNTIFDNAKKFAEADIIVISAPYWDLSFPAILKIYIENIMVSGITFSYSPEGIPLGLCKARKLYYISTAGGPFTANYGYDYIRSLCTDMFGIKETELIKAEMLDIDGNNPEEIVQAAIENI